MPKKNSREPEAFTVRIPPSLLKSFDEICHTQNKSRNRAIIESMAQFVEVQGDYIGSRQHFQMSMDWQTEEKFGRAERLQRKYFTLIISMLSIIANSLLKGSVMNMAMFSLDENDEVLYPVLKKKAAAGAPPKPEDRVPPKPNIPKY